MSFLNLCYFVPKYAEYRSQIFKMSFPNFQDTIPKSLGYRSQIFKYRIQKLSNNTFLLKFYIQKRTRPVFEQCCRKNIYNIFIYCEILHSYKYLFNLFHLEIAFRFPLLFWLAFPAQYPRLSITVKEALVRGSSPLDLFHYIRPFVALYIHS